MSALSDYLAAVKRQATLLADAEAMDAGALYGGSNPRCSPGHVRPWTRYDKRRADYERQRDEQRDELELAMKCAQHSGPPVPIELLSAPAVQGRMDTRLYRVLRRWPAPDHMPALAEAKQEGTYGAVAPAILELAEAYRIVRRLYAGKDYDESWDGHSTQLDDWETAKARFNRAIGVLGAYALETTPGGDEQGASLVPVRQRGPLCPKCKTQTSVRSTTDTMQYWQCPKCKETGKQRRRFTERRL
jgi:ribosomal protein L37AE/L43A